MKESFEYMGFSRRERRIMAPAKYYSIKRDYSKPKEFVWVIIGSLAFIIATWFAASIVFHFPVATAADRPAGVLTKKEACAWERVSGEIISTIQCI